MPGRNSTDVATMDGVELPSSIVLVNLHVYMGIYPESRVLKISRVLLFGDVVMCDV